MGGIVKSFLCLIEIQILWKTALTDDYDVGGMGNRLQVNRIQKSAELPMSKHRISGGSTQDLLVLAENDIQNKIDPAKGGGLFDVPADRIGFYIARASILADHHGMVSLYGAACGATGHDRF